MYLKENLVEVILGVKLQLQSGADRFIFFSKIKGTGVNIFSFCTNTNNMENYEEFFFLNT